jgi:NAD(P)-dependent dehydrogenase (short-subunit alcohol dehydrogenase family)
MQQLKDKIVLVTGGARGLGAAICENLFEAGAQVIAVDMREDLLRETCNKMQDNGRSAQALTVDLCDERQIEHAIQSIVEQYGRLDVVVNNAGADQTLSVEELSIADFDRVMAVNLRAPFVVAKYAFPVMKKNGGGHIVNIASTAAKRAWANAAAYHASKWGLMGLSHTLHVEGRPHNIKVTAVVTGGMRTPFLLDRFPDIDVNNLQDPKNVAETVRFVLLQPRETVIPEIMVLPMRETSWP